jgi:hypothetical protein
LQGCANAVTISQTTKLGRPSHLSSGYAADDLKGANRALSASSSPIGRMTGMVAPRRGQSGSVTIRRPSCWLRWQIICPPAQARQSCPASSIFPPARAGLLFVEPFLFFGPSAAPSVMQLKGARGRITHGAPAETGPTPSPCPSWPLLAARMLAFPSGPPFG